MLGAYRGERAVRMVDAAAIALLVVAGIILSHAARGQARHLRRQLRGR